MKCELAQEFVVGGFTDPQGKRVGLGAHLDPLSARPRDGQPGRGAEDGDHHDSDDDLGPGVHDVLNSFLGWAIYCRST